jgi:GntR family transcriptional regulator/MocR family aminotransferase
MRRIAASFLPAIPLDPGSGTPMYRQLSDWFRRAIVEGRLRPGQRVPSSRNLSRELNISRIPVLTAYEQLFAEGYLETFVGAGTCVARSIPDEAVNPQGVGTRSTPLPAAGHAAPRRVAERVAAIRKPTQTWARNLGAFRVGLPALTHFPAAAWAKLVTRHARKPAMAMLAYGDPMGHLPFRAAIAEYLSTVRAVSCEASQILVTTGSQQGLLLSAQVLLDPGDRAWVEEPGYPGVRQALRTIGAQLVPMPVDREGMRVDEDPDGGVGVRAAYVTPSHQFPLGTTMSATRRMQLLNWATRNGGWIVEDDYDSEYRFGGRPIASLQGLATDDRVIYVGTFSKIMFASLRLGYVVVPKDLIPAFADARDAADTFSSTLHQAVMTDFIREGHFARHIRRMRVLYLERRTALLEAISANLGDRLEVIGTEAGMHLVALLPPGIDDVAVSIKAATLGIAARPLSICYLHPPQRGGLILGYGGANVHEIREGMRKLATCI